MTIYAGSHGGCMMCDSLAYELAANGHRKGCRSPYAHEPPQPKPPPAEQALEKREQARALRAQADGLESEASALEQQATKDRGE